MARPALPRVRPPNFRDEANVAAACAHERHQDGLTEEQFKAMVTELVKVFSGGHSMRCLRRESPRVTHVNGNGIQYSGSVDSSRPCDRGTRGFRSAVAKSSVARPTYIPLGR